MSVRWGEPTPGVEVPVGWTRDDPPYLGFLTSPARTLPELRDPAERFANWELGSRYRLRETKRGVLTMTCHPQVIGRGHRWLRLEEWLDRLVDGDVAFTPVAAVAAMAARGERLGGAAGGVRRGALACGERAGFPAARASIASRSRQPGVGATVGRLRLGVGVVVGGLWAVWGGCRCRSVEVGG
ncbi:hypothetical protein GCM10022402_35360 [Salinactinospora qingdaonensis]|uniref:Polysaccharide deacetylase n=1 Tax=Salinactinospora qingdaonensis TaxID=702744 RepID=A0ABP7G3J0_9ACTN